MSSEVPLVGFYKCFTHNFFSPQEQTGIREQLKEKKCNKKMYFHF